MDLDNNVLDELIDVIYKRIEQKFAKQLNSANVEYAFAGIITEINTSNNTAVVDIGSSTTDYIPNLTGFSVGTEDTNLKIGDTVKVFSDRNNMVGAYIGVKLS